MKAPKLSQGLNTSEPDCVCVCVLCVSIKNNLSIASAVTIVTVSPLALCSHGDTSK